jgi:predicted MFS family arabinose efflux permease
MIFSIMTQRWNIFLALAALSMIGYFYRISMAVTSHDLASDLGLNAAQLGVLSGVFFYAFAFAQIPVGFLIDRFGSRRIIFLTGIMTTMGSLIFAYSRNYPSALAGRVLMGLGTASILMGALKIYSSLFTEREFPRVTGYMIAAGNLGSLGATAPLAYAIGTLSWRPAFLLITILQGCAVIWVYLTVRDIPAGTEPFTRHTAVPELNRESGVREVLKSLSFSLDFWFVALFAYFFYANYMVLLSLWGGPYLMEAVGLDRSQSGTILLCISCGYISGTLLLGTAIDFLKGSLKRTILYGQTLLLLCMSIMLGPAEHLSLPLLGATFFAIGFFAASGVVIYPLARRLVTHRYAATAMTAVNFFLLMGAATMQHVMGHYISSFPKGVSGYQPAVYHGAFLIPICGLACLLTLFSIHTLYRGFDRAYHNPH